MVVDSGNALFRIPGVPDDAARQRASFILKTMGELGTAVMAAGARDLAAGPEFLQKEAAAAHVKVLSANLALPDGGMAFAPSTVVRAGGVRFGLVGVTSPLVSGARPPVPAALAEAQRLRGRADVVVALAAVGFADAHELAVAGKGAFDFILQSSDARVGAMAQKEGAAYVIPSGERGRQMNRLTLRWAGKKGFADMSEVERNRQTLKQLDVQIAEVHRRLSAEPDGGPNGGPLRQTLATFEQRRREVAASVSAGEKAASQGFTLEVVNLDGSIREDPALQAEVARIEPVAPH